MKSLALTRSARARLHEIVAYTIERYGRDQALAYRRQLVATAVQLCDSPFPLGKPCPVVDDVGRSSALRYLISGRHYLVFSETEDSITIHEFVHVRRDLPAIVGALSAGTIRV